MPLATSPQIPSRSPESNGSWVLEMKDAKSPSLDFEKTRTGQTSPLVTGDNSKQSPTNGEMHGWSLTVSHARSVISVTTASNC